MALGYRAFFTVPGTADLLERSQEQLHAWLRSKRYDADRLNGEGPRLLADGVTGGLLHDAGPDGSATLRSRIVEETKRDERWTTELTVHRAARRGNSWVWLDIVRPEHASFAATPRLARDLLAVLPAQDGDLRLSATPEVVDVHDVDDLVRALQGADRRGLAFVAGTGEGWPLQQWTDYVGRLLRQTNGLASGYVLNAAATIRFEELVGSSHAVRAATVRTFEPRLLIRDRTDGLRHRVLGTERISRDTSGHLARFLGHRARDLALGTPIPSDARRLDQVLRRRLDDQLVAEARPVRAPVLVPAAPTAPPAVPHQDRRDAQQVEIRAAFTALVRELTGSEQLTVEALEGLRTLRAREEQVDASAVAQDAAVDQLQARIRDLEASVDQERELRQLTESLYDDEQLERAQAEQDRAAAERHLRHVQCELAPTVTDASLWVPPPPRACPVDHRSQRTVATSWRVAR